MKQTRIRNCFKKIKSSAILQLYNLDIPFPQLYTSVMVIWCRRSISRFLTLHQAWKVKKIYKSDIFNYIWYIMIWHMYLYINHLNLESGQNNELQQESLS